MKQEDIDVSIRMGWMAGLVLSGMAMYPVAQSNVLDAKGLLGMWVPGLLAIGVNKKSRYCAVGLFIWFVGVVLANIVMWLWTGHLNSPLLFLVIVGLTYFAYEGIRGTYAHYRLCHPVVVEPVAEAATEDIEEEPVEKKVPSLI